MRSAKAAPRPVVRIAADALVRARPDAAGAPLGLALRGDALPAADPPAAGGWRAVLYRGRRGWVAERFLKME